MVRQTQLRTPVTDEDHAQGPSDAALVLVEYGDYECSYCGAAYIVIKRLQATLQKDLRFVFRNFPLAESHAHALDAARAAEAAGLQGKFWEMHDALYENQDALEKENLVEHATALGLNPERFARDMRGTEVGQRIQLDIYSGARSGVNGTPTLFVNGLRYEGELSEEPLLETLNAIRGQSRWPSKPRPYSET